MLRPSRIGIPDDFKHPVGSSLRNKSTAQICDVLLLNESMDVRWKAAFALRRRRDSAAIESLWQSLPDDPVRMVRQQSAVAFGKIGSIAVLSPLIETLWYDRNAGPRQACVVVLGNLGSQIA